jgi:hypothetical protein
MPKWIHPEHYTAFENETEAMDFCKTWGLLPQKATKQKEYRYKGHNMDVACEIAGYADLVFAVIRMGDQLHNIHPSYLREMQSAQYGKGKPEEEGDSSESEAEEIVEVKQDVVKKEPKPENKKEKKIVEKAVKEAPMTLPEGKVNVEAIIIEFASVPNPFSDTDDEVIIFEQVSLLHDNETIALESAWSSHSNAMKKLELQIGDKLAFESKVVAKKLNKHPVKYKLNNAAKITKVTPE